MAARIRLAPHPVSLPELRGARSQRRPQVASRGAPAPPARVIKNPLVEGDELWDAMSFLARRFGIPDRSAGLQTEPGRRVPFLPLFLTEP